MSEQEKPVKWIRLVSTTKADELYINVDHISRIEVLKTRPKEADDKECWCSAIGDGKSMHFFRLHVDGKPILLITTPHDKVDTFLQQTWYDSVHCLE